MSLILDALRKSEHQRQRESGPAMAVVPQAGAESRRASWPLLLAALLALNVVFVGWLLLKDGERPPPPPAGAEAGAGQAATLPGANRPSIRENATRSPAVTARSSEALPLADKPPRQEVRPLSTEVGSAASPSPGTASGAASGRPGATAASAGARTADQQPSGDASAADTATADARLPRFSDMVVRGELNVPHLHLDIHVYSGDPAERFVFINMQRYNEGQAIREGPSVQRITRDGVVMSHQGRRFFLPRD